ncbi:MAG TPA: hypothetical protein VF720_04660 [Candidatus Eisenbacteria bacterium]
MKRADAVEWRRHRRGTGKRSLRGNWAWGITALLVLATAGMGVVWQKVRYEGDAIRHADLMAMNARLTGELETEKFEFNQHATRATLVPKADQLGLVDVPSDAIVLVSFPDAPAPTNPILDGFVGEALASSGARDGQ